MIKIRATLAVCAGLLLAPARAPGEAVVSGSNTTTAVGELSSRLAAAILEKGHRSVAVFAFRGTGGITSAEATSLAAGLAAALSRETGLEVLDLTASGTAEEKSAGSLGREAGAEVVILGTVAPLPSSFALEIRMIDSSTESLFGKGEFFLDRDARIEETLSSPAKAASIPSFETESFRLRVVGAKKELRANRTWIIVDLVVESLVHDRVGLLGRGPEFRGTPPGSTDSWRLVDEVGHRFEQSGVDSAGICSPAHDAGIDLLPSGRVSTRFKFVSPERVDASRVTLSGTEVAPRPGRRIEIAGIKVSDER